MELREWFVRMNARRDVESAVPLRIVKALNPEPALQTLEHLLFGFRSSRSDAFHTTEQRCTSAIIVSIFFDLYRMKGVRGIGGERTIFSLETMSQQFASTYLPAFISAEGVHFPGAEFSELVRIFTNLLRERGRSTS